MARPPIRPWFQAALAALALAAATGALLRGALAFGWDLGASLGNVRHAHSHAMYFAWVTPALFLLMAHRAGALSRPTAHAIGAALSLGAITHPLFLRFGYSSVAIGDARLPLSAMACGLAVLAWYAYVGLFARRTRGRTGDGTLLAWRLALGVLVLSTLAVWPLSLLRPLGLDAARLTPVLSHAFLDPFSEGFLVLAVLGLAYAERGARPPRWALYTLALAALPMFPLGLAPGLLPMEARCIASAASIAWGVALLALLRTLAGLHRRWRAPLALGAGAALARIVAGAAPWIDWSAAHGLRILYLHALLLGFVSLGVLAAARALLGRRGVPFHGLVQASALSVIAALLPLSEAWPRAWSGRWIAVAAALTAALSAVVLIASFTASLLPRRPRRTALRTFDRPLFGPSSA
ncbi:MAG TPA: hypothetical protein VIL20_22640 [Sandaracinaceae bacterium]